MISLKPLKLIERSTEQFPDGTYKWLAECGCGKRFLVRKRNVDIGQTKSCGCYRQLNSKAMRLLEAENREYGIDIIISNKFIRYQQSASKRNRVFLLTFSEFSKLVSSECYYCGLYRDKLNGIDRLDNSKGYELSNCVSCCSICNYFKGSLDYKDFIILIDQVYSNLVKYREVG